MHTLSETWNEYERKILDPIDASSTQRRETRRAFYGGANAFANLILHGLSADPEPTADDFGLIESLILELNVFLDRVRAGTA